MDNRIRKNEICIINLPKCDYVFSSTRSCFIGYGFKESSLETQIIKTTLEQRGIEAQEAGVNVTPGQYAFCTKICSKIITSQFCIILLNNDHIDGRDVPNANVNMEYGLMLGFNKYVIPFAREGQKLAFNISGLDTIFYTNQNFGHLVQKAIDHAINATKQSENDTTDLDTKISTYLLNRNLIISSLTDAGEKQLFDLGKPCGFNFLNGFSGLEIVYFGNFPHLQPFGAAWRIKKLREILNARFASLNDRLRLGIISSTQMAWIQEMLTRMRLLVLVASEKDKSEVLHLLGQINGSFPVELIVLEDLDRALNIS